jgi:hypothetical protein
MTAFKKQAHSVLRNVSQAILYVMGAIVHYCQVARNYYVMTGKFQRHNGRSRST